jgi:tRNA(Ile)-lysidine synthase
MCSDMKDVDFSIYKDLDWIIALSGGADSRLLLELASEYKYLAKSIKAVYVNHHLQEISNSWADFCISECKILKIDCVVEDVYVDVHGSVEANARTARYNALEKHVTANSVLFTAHHADDLLESVLLAIIRGAGIDGLAVMPASRKFGKGILARPLIRLSRKDIENECTQRCLSYVTDPTNKDTAYDRNFLRHNITPLLKDRFPQILKNTERTVSNLCADKMILDSYLESLLNSLYVTIYGAPGIKNDELKLLNIREQYSVLRYFFKNICGIVLSRAQLSLVLALDESKSGNKACLKLGDDIISIYRGVIYFSLFIDENCLLQIKPNEQFSVKNVKISLEEMLNNSSNDQVILSKQQVTAIDKQSVNNLACIFYLGDNDKLTIKYKPVSSLRMSPDCRVHSQTLKNLWKEYAVPLYLRNRFPLVLIGETVQGMYGLFKDKRAQKIGKAYILKIRYESD